MERKEFIAEYVNSVVAGYEEENVNDIKECVEDCLKVSIEITNYNGYEDLTNFRALTQEDYLKISSYVCGVINLKSSMNAEEEITYKLIKEKGKTLDGNFSSMIKESTSRLQGAMFYTMNQ